jgi:uncharacterized protein (DUF697 family)
MSVYQGSIGSEFGESEEFEWGGEYEGGGELLTEEFGETPEAHEQFLGSILGSVLGGEVAALSEQEEIELASELLEITSEEELEQFLGNVFKKVSRGVGSFIKSPVGRALGGVLKNVAKKALPVVGGALGSMVAPGIGTAIGSKLGSLAGGLFEVQLEGVLPEQAEYEVARRYVNLAASAARNAALARPRGSANPLTVARAAVARAARTYAPGLHRQMMRSLRGGRMTARPGVPRPPYRRPGAPSGPPMQPRPRPASPQPGFVPGPAVAMGVSGDSPGAVPMGIPDDVFEPVEPSMDGAAVSGRWVRRGSKIIVLGA